MLITIRKGATPDAIRLLVVAPDTPGLASLKATAAGGELATMSREATGVHIDALIGTVALTGPNDSLSDVLLAGNYTLLQLISHGNSSAVELTGETVPAEEFSRILSQHGIILVLVMTCDSLEFARALVAGGIQRAIGTTGAIENEDARVFSREFYTALAAGRDIPAAVAYARSRMREEGARQIVLLPDEADAGPIDPLLIEVRGMRQDLRALHAKVDTAFEQINRSIAQQATRSHNDMRAMAAAMTNLGEVLSQ